MAATATPTILDPIQLFRVSSITTSDVTQYTAPNEAGVRVVAGAFTNKTTSPVTLQFWRETTGGAICMLLQDVSIPGDGIPVSFKELGLEDIILLPQEELHTDAGTGSALDGWADGIELKD